MINKKEEPQEIRAGDLDWFDQLMKQSGGGAEPEPPPHHTEAGVCEEPPEGSADTDYRCTELANGEIFLRAHGEDLRYCYERQAWLAWTGQRWSWESAQQEVERRTTEVARSELSEALAGTSKPVRAWAKRSCAVGARRSMAESVRHQLGVSVGELDADPLLFNVANGTLELSSGLLLSPRRGDLLTHTSPVAYQPRAQAPRWERFLQEITGGSAGLAEYLQRAVGYSLTARMDEQQLFVCVGAGSNGKSVFLGALHTVLGTYARTISAALLTDGTPHNKYPELATLPGVRLAAATEPSARAQLDEPLSKALTGGDELVGERKFEAPFVFRPVCKVWLACNRIPSFQSGGFSMERRLVVVPFRQTFAGEAIDRRLPEKLAREAPGVLRWAVEGCTAWLSKGLEQPEEIRTAIDEARGDTDPLHHWFAECVVAASAKARVAISDLYSSYKVWCEGANQKPKDLDNFRSLIKGRSLELVTIKRRIYAVGIGLTVRPRGQTDLVDEEEYD